MHSCRSDIYHPVVINIRTLLFAILICAFAATCTALPPASMPEPAVEKPNALSFVGNRDEAVQIATSALEELGLDVMTIDPEAGFVGADNGINEKSWGERIGVYFREQDDGSMRMWVVSLRKGVTSQEAPDWTRSVIAALERRIAKHPVTGSATSFVTQSRAGEEPLDAETGSRAFAASTPVEAAPEQPWGEITGSCFAVDPEGRVLTSHRAVGGATAVRVHFTDGSTLDATVERVLPGVDIAMLRLSQPTPEFLALSSENRLKAEDPVFTLSFASATSLGSEPAFAYGAIKATSGPTGEKSLMETSVPIEPGRSGGPMVDEKARVIGIVTPVPAAVRVLQARGELNPEHSWAVNSEYAKALFPGESPQRTAAADRWEAIDQVRAALCQVEARFR